MSPSRAEIFRGPSRWLPAAALFALAPKCIVCLAAYAGVGAALGVKLGGPEICGDSAGPLEGQMVWLSMLVAAAGVIVLRRLSRAGIKNAPEDSIGRCRAGACPRAAAALRLERSGAESN